MSEIATRDSTKDTQKQINNNTLYFRGDSVYKGDNDNISGKVDLNAQNLSSAGKSLVAGLSMPSITCENLTLLASGSSYTAPANGWVCFYKTAGSSGVKYVLISLLDSNDNVVYKKIMYTAGGTGDATSVVVPVCDGQKFTLTYTSTGNTDFRFIYAQGSESEAS